MEPETREDNWLESLRNKAEKVLTAKGKERLFVSINDVQKLIHEINVYHTELDLQNQELRSVQHQLEISRNKYFELFDWAPIGYFAIDPTGVVEEVNLSGAELVGLDRSRVKRMPFVGFVDQADHRRLYAFFRQTLTGRNESPLYIKIRKGDGSLLDAQIEGALVDYTERDRKQILLSMTDISSLRNAERVIAENEVKFRSLVEFSVDQIFMLSADGIYLASNDRVAHFGIERGDQLVGLSIEDVYDPETARLYRRQLQEVVTTQQPVIFEHQMDSHGAEPIYHVDTLYPIIENGRLISIGGICRDITGTRKAETEKRQLEQQLVRAQKMEAIGLLAGGIAHDFNNILSTVMGFTELCLDDTRVCADTIGYLQMVMDASRRAKGLVQQILTFSRKAEHDLKPIDPVPVIKESIDFLRHSLPSSIILTQQITESPMLVNSNPTQLHQMIFNLGINAFHAMEDQKGTVDIRIDKKHIDDLTGPAIDFPSSTHYAVMEISDDGSGIPENILDKVFDPYFTTKETGSGTGLGLSVVLGIVKGHGGDIRVRSEVGVGTVFTIYLPAIQTDGDERVENETSCPGVDDLILRNTTVIMVDDEESIVKLAKRFLVRMGFRVVTFTTAEDALEYMKQNATEVDLLITDKTMPDMTGLELAASIKRLRPDFPVVLSSGYNSPPGGSDDVNCVDVFLQKPYTQKELRNAIAAAMGKRNAVLYKTPVGV